MVLFPLLYLLSKYRQAAVAATEPSATAVVSCRSSLARQSPGHTKVLAEKGLLQRAFFPPL